jgi:probable HAF family extracellular repeat protein
MPPLGRTLTWMLRPFLAALALLAAPHWVRTDLPVPKAHPNLFVVSRGVNAQGAAIYVGTFGAPGRQHQLAFLWRNGALTSLTDANAPWVDVYGINSSATVVGDAHARAVVWRNGKPTYLAKEPSTARALNDHGTIVGDDQREAVIWLHGTEQPLDGVATVTAINDHDQVIGETPGDGGAAHAMLWQNGTTSDLGSIGGAASWATDINESGLAVGYVSTNLGFPLSAVEWRDGQLVDLGRFGALGAQAVSVNDAGDVLVQLVDSRGDPSAIVLVRDGRPVAVPGEVARTVDAQGQVLGDLQTAAHGRRSFVWRNGKTTLLPTSDGASPPWGGPNVIAGAWAIGDEYVALKSGGSTSHAVLWRRR